MSNENNIAPINKDLNVVKYEVEEIKQKIYTIRGKQVMLDSDVAEKYHYLTKNINKAMKRNVERFPEDFCFQLTEDEMKKLWFQNGTTYENIKYRSEKYLPYVYTEQGIAMLSGLLKNDIAVKVSINIMRAFVEMRHFIYNNAQVFERLTNVEYKLLDHDKKFEEVFNQFQIKDNVEQKIFFDGQVYDAFSMMVDLIKKAENEIILIDNYVDIDTLNILSKKNDKVNIEIYTKKKTKLNLKDINKFNTQYPKEGLMKKLESRWEEPAEDEIDLIYKVDRKNF